MEEKDWSQSTPSEKLEYANENYIGKTVVELNWKSKHVVVPPFNVDGFGSLRDSTGAGLFSCSPYKKNNGKWAKIVTEKNTIDWSKVEPEKIENPAKMEWISTTETASNPDLIGQTVFITGLNFHKKHPPTRYFMEATYHSNIHFSEPYYGQEMSDEPTGVTHYCVPKI